MTPYARRAPPPTNEAQRQRDIREALGREPDLVLWRNNVGVANHTNGIATRYGLCVGSSDLIGILAPHGRFIALEVKTNRGCTTPEQDLFLALVRRKGGFACVVRSVSDAVQALQRARNGATE